ncbi:MAG: hypothetical protein HC837_18575 [Chloroflexaceae bacterium]|nr:hypothetical protein [Chloroflexaceae bacterium]
MYVPAIKYARPVRLFEIGPYRAILLTDCESEGTIQYAHVLFVHEHGSRMPCFAVAAEIQTALSWFADLDVDRSDVDVGSHVLGVFPGDGHINMGNSDAWADLDTFLLRALELVRQHLAVTEQPRELPLPPA